VALLPGALERANCRAVAKSERTRLPTDLAEALSKQETPQIKWKVILQIAAGVAVLWVTAFMGVPFIGYWGVGVVAVLTSVVIGFGIYVWRMTARSRAILDIMKQATDEGGRERALAALSDSTGKDALKLIARAQLLSQTDPLEAQRTLEGIDLEKAPAILQDDVRAQLALLYLRNNRPRDARVLTDAIRLDRRPDAKSKGLYAAVMAESFARTGSPDEARKLLETYNADDDAYDEVRVMLLRAQVFTFIALKKLGLARRAMDGLVEIEPNLLGGFLIKGSPPDVGKLARQVLSEHGAGPKQKIKRI
jgi:hypothetical protein